jgi:hypothetical protein
VEHGADARIGHDTAERREIGEDERINEPGVARDVGDLDEGEPFRVVMETVALGVDGDLGAREEPPGESGEIVSGTDPERRDGSRPGSLGVAHEGAVDAAGPARDDDHTPRQRIHGLSVSGVMVPVNATILAVVPPAPSPEGTVSAER